MMKIPGKRWKTGRLLHEGLPFWLGCSFDLRRAELGLC